MKNQNQNVSADNIYKLNGRVPLSKAIPFGLQHVLAMFVSNLAPVLIVCSAAFVHGTNDHLTGAEITFSYIRSGRSDQGFRSLWESALLSLEVY